MPIEHVNPPSLYENPAYSHAVVVRQPGATIYVGGQNGIDADGNVAGDDVATQTAQALSNVEAALEAAGADLHSVVQWTIAVVDDRSFAEGAQVFADRWGTSSPPPALNVTVVAGLANPAFLVEVSAIAAI